MAVLNVILPKLTIDKLKALDRFLTTWDPSEGWLATAPLAVEERNLVSQALWSEQEITWLVYSVPC